MKMFDNMTAKDRVALIIVTGLIAWGLVMMISLTITKRSMGDGAGELFLAIGTGLVTSLGVYFSTRNGGGNGNTKQ